MTPAEKLAKRKQRQRPRRNSSTKSGPVVCHCRQHREALNLSLRDVADASLACTP
jgi:hypothetical protein